MGCRPWLRSGVGHWILATGHQKERSYLGTWSLVTSWGLGEWLLATCAARRIQVGPGRLGLRPLGERVLGTTNASKPACLGQRVLEP